MTFSELVAEVAQVTHQPRSRVAMILQSFVDVTTHALEVGEEVNLLGFGAFYTADAARKGFLRGRDVSDSRRIIKFRESKRRRAKMDKYSVQYDEEKTKTASTSKVCPKCGHPIDPSTPNYCEHCGTEPWEKRPEKK